MPNEIDKGRRDLDKVLRNPVKRPDSSVSLTRRTFLQRSLVTGTALGAGAASLGLLPLVNTIDVAQAAGESFRFAWVSDTHLYGPGVNERFVDKTVKAFKEIQGMSPSADFMIFGGDLAQKGRQDELQLGSDLLKEVKIKKLFIPGEHDWYLDMGAEWEKRFGGSPWSMDHKGVRIIGLNTIGHAPDYWTAKKMSPEERMGHMEALDGTVAGAWAGLGRPQLKWLSDNLAGWPKDKPIIVFSHNPLYNYYAPWNFWVRDWQEVQEILGPYSNVTNVHGHTHQVLYNEIGTMRSIGMLATSWPWPYAPGVPNLTTPMVRVDPGDHFDGVGWGSLTGGDRVENEYMMWRKDIFATAQADSGAGDEGNQVLNERIADKQWPY
ncbi:MAG: metallophosphoesterase [Rhodospirillales bacterium]|nr:metallophosphoesterase [Rhodospirillales bacterium]